MNKFLKSFVVFSILTLLNNSCNVSNDVVQNTRISKRKYTKGLNIQKRNNHIFPELNFKEYNRNNNLGLKKNNPNKSDKSFIKSFIIDQSNDINNDQDLLAFNDNTSDFEQRSNKAAQPSLIQNNKISTKNKSFRNIVYPVEEPEDEEKVQKKAWRNFMLNLFLPGVGTFLSGSKLIGLLQLLLFVGGIFGAIWIFWNTYISLFFPILISVFAYGWSFHSGYKHYVPSNSEIIKTEINSIINENEITADDLEKINKKEPKSNSKLAETRNNYKDYKKLKKVEKEKAQAIVINEDSKKDKDDNYNTYNPSVPDGKETKEYKRAKRMLISGAGLLTTVGITSALLATPWMGLYLVAYLFMLDPLIIALNVIALSALGLLLIGLLFSVFGLIKMRKIHKEYKLREEIKKELQG